MEKRNNAQASWVVPLRFQSRRCGSYEATSAAEMPDNPWVGPGNVRLNSPTQQSVCTIRERFRARVHVPLYRCLQKGGESENFTTFDFFEFDFFQQLQHTGHPIKCKSRFSRIFGRDQALFVVQISCSLAPVGFLNTAHKTTTKSSASSLSWPRREYVDPSHVTSITREPGEALFLQI